MEQLPKIKMCIVNLNKIKLHKKLILEFLWQNKESADAQDLLSQRYSGWMALDAFAL